MAETIAWDTSVSILTTILPSQQLPYQQETALPSMALRLLRLHSLSIIEGRLTW